MSSREDIIGRYLDKTVPVHFNPGFVVLSFVVSLLGAGSTLELINRRTSWKGLYNHLLLVGAAISMGGIAIWSMHFVGNQAIILLNNESELQIAYSIHVTAASFFVPIVVLLLAFLTVSSNNEVKWWRILLAGSLSGGAICGMHYLGDASISNYHCTYNTINVVCAAVIAVTASSVALALFFVFKAAWNNAWWKRVGCMNVLAGAVSGMHWCAALGTEYTLIEAPSSNGPGTSRNTTVIAVICLSVTASFIMVGVAVYSAKTMKNYAAKAQQIVLAAAVFDSQGRILVNPDGRLPSEKITDSFPQKGQDDIFSTSHPLFHWMYRASHNWSPIKALLGSMTTHLNYLRECEPGHRVNHNRDIKLVRDSGSLIDNYELVFRELFCLAASTLATRMAEDITDVGVLWDEIFATGQRKQPARPNTRLSSRLDVLGGSSTKGAAQSDAASNHEDVEKGYAMRQNDPHHVGQGSLMFLVRHLNDPHDVTRLEAAGFLFAEPNRVTDIIRTSMQIKTRCLDEKFREMAVKASSTPVSPTSSTSSQGSALLDPGVHVGIFAIRARVDKVGFDVLVKRSARSALPTVKLALGSRGLEQGHLDLLRELDGLPVQTLLRKLACMTEPVFNAQQVYFATQLRTAAAALRAQVDDPALDTATLSAKVIEVPCRPAAMDGTVLSPTSSSRPSIASNAPIMTTCSLISLQLVLDIHDHFDGNKMTEFIPLPFFKAQQMVYDNSPHQAAFSQSLHREISEIMTIVPSESWSNPLVAALHGGNPGHHGRGHAAKSSAVSIRSGSTANLCAGDQSGLESGRTSPPPFDDVHAAAGGPPLPPKPSLFGGIMVSQEVAVSVSDAGALGSRVSERLGLSGGGNNHNARSASTKKLTSTVITKQRKGSGESTVEIVEKGAMSPMSPLSRQPSSVGRPSPLSPVVLYASNVEASANNGEEQSTFVDELFKNCIRRRS